MVRMNTVARHETVAVTGLTPEFECQLKIRSAGLPALDGAKGLVQIGPGWL